MNIAADSVRTYNISSSKIGDRQNKNMWMEHSWKFFYHLTISEKCSYTRNFKEFGHLNIYNSEWKEPENLE